MTTRVTTPNPNEAAAALLAEQPARAEAAARALIAARPGDPGARLILASALRRQGRAADAMPLLARLAAAFPRAARTRYELGMCHAALDMPDAARAALEQAVTLDPRHREAWRALADQAFAMGDDDAAGRAEGALERLALADLPSGAVLVAAFDRIVRKDGEGAKTLLRHHLATRPDDAVACRMLAGLYAGRRAFPHAETLLRHAIAIDPMMARARFDLAHALFEQQRAAEALDILAPLMVADGDIPAYANLAGACHALLGDDARNLAIHEDLAIRFPHNPNIQLNLGHARRTAGDRAGAIAAYRRALAITPALGEAYWSLANLKVATLSQDDAAAMDALRATATGEDRVHLDYALGKWQEDAGNAAAAFARYAAGAALRRAAIPHDAEAADIAAQAGRALYTPAFLAARAGWGDPSDAPIFILGLPRAGSTLVEQILASHPDVEGTMELPYVGHIAAGSGHADIEAWDAAAAAAHGAAYLAAAAPHRRLGRARFIDKMPNNFQHIGLIRLMLPNARIIDVRRHPMAAGLAMFKQLFATGQDFSYDLADIGRHYRRYLETMRHFAVAAPGAVHRVIYEDLVEDFEATVRRLLDHVGLPFHPACLRFHENERAVRTVSSEQVRQPLFRSGLDAWRAFDPWLDPLRESLGATLVDWRAGGH